MLGRSLLVVEDNSLLRELLATALEARDFIVYTGDYDGFLWKLEQATKSDDSNAYYAGFKTPPLTFDSPRQTKIYRNVRIITKTQGNFYLQIKWWVDGEYQNSGTISFIF